MVGTAIRMKQAKTNNILAIVTQIQTNNCLLCLSQHFTTKKQVLDFQCSMAQRMKSWLWLQQLHHTGYQTSLIYLCALAEIPWRNIHFQNSSITLFT